MSNMHLHGVYLPCLPNGVLRASCFTVEALPNHGSSGAIATAGGRCAAKDNSFDSVSAAVGMDPWEMCCGYCLCALIV